MEDEHELTPHRSKSLRAQLVALALDALLVAACASTIQATGGDNLVPCSRST